MTRTGIAPVSSALRPRSVSCQPCDVRVARLSDCKFARTLCNAGAGYDGSGTGDVVLGAQDTGLASAMGCPATKVGFQPGRIDVLCDMCHFWSFHSGGGNFLRCDGSVAFYSYTFNNVLSGLFSINGGEVLVEP